MSHYWRDDAACLHVPPEIFFPHENDHTGRADARRICRTCPVADACLDDAIRNPADGIRAGLTRRQRGHIARTRKEPAT